MRIFISYVMIKSIMLSYDKLRDRCILKVEEYNGRTSPQNKWAWWSVNQILTTTYPETTQEDLKAQIIDLICNLKDLKNRRCRSISTEIQNLIDYMLTQIKNNELKEQLIAAGVEDLESTQESQPTPPPLLTQLYDDENLQSDDGPGNLSPSSL